MSGAHVFSSKAEKYDRYRWSYAPEAILTIFEITKISNTAVVADIGAGTGILTREFVGRVGRIYAVEPNPEMRMLATKNLVKYPFCQIVDGRAESTTLPDHAVDLLTAAQAIHWFEPQAAKKEFRRILKPGGWLAICRNFGNDPAMEKAQSEIYPPQTDTENQMIGKSQLKDYYFSEGHYQKLEFPFSRHVQWDEFFGGLCSASFAPDEDSTFYPDFKRGAQEVFERFSKNDFIEIRGITELYLGQMQR